MRIITTILALCPLLAFAAGVDPVYERIAEQTGGKVYKVTPEQLNDPAIRDTIINDMLGNPVKKPGYGSVEFYRFRLVHETIGAHGGLFPVKEPQPAGANVIGEATLFGDIKDVKFFLLDEQNKKISDISLSRETDTSTDYYGQFTMPDVPFKVAANGTDKAGQMFERYSEFTVPKKPTDK